jgi:O-antigen biosynthesis protein
MTIESRTDDPATSHDISRGSDAEPVGLSTAGHRRVEAVRRLEKDLQDAYATLEVSEERAASLESTLVSLEGSGSYRLARIFAAAAHRAAPDETKRGQAMRFLVATANGAHRLDLRPHMTLGQKLAPADQRWNAFCRRNDPGAARLRRMRQLSQNWKERPLVSIVMPTYNSNKRFLSDAIRSVKAQAYEHWELCIVDDGSPDDTAARVVSNWSRDPRIRFAALPANGGIARASQRAAEMATGPVITFLDHDDVLRPHALFEVVRYLRTHPSCDLVYSDEDRLDQSDRRIGAHLKADWSPELLESCNYMCHLTAIRRELFDRAGGFRDGFDGSQDYDLFLRCTELAREIGHVREVLYSWRIHRDSVAGRPLSKPEAFLAGTRCLKERLARLGVDGTVVPGAWMGMYHVSRAIAGSPTVGVVIPTRDAVDLLGQSVACVEREAELHDVRLVIVDNDSADAATLEYLAGCGHMVVPGPGAFNFSRLVNLGVAALGPVEHVLLLNNDIVGAKPGWLGALLAQSQRPEIGAVGARLLYSDGTPQHEGIRVGGQGGAADNLDLSKYFGLGLTCRTVSAVTGACLMVKRSVWNEVNGFDESLRVAFNDVDFCLRVMRAGYRNVYTPLAELTHLESASRGRRHPAEDERQFGVRWGPFPQGYDGYVGGHIYSFKPLDYR